jgi:predicted ATP-grasp superfamily ATP-dependent carboligase
MTDRLVILVTGLGGLVARQMALSLMDDGTNRVIGCDSDHLKPFLYQEDNVSDIHILPHVSDEKYLDAMSELCRTENVSLIAATGEAEVEVLASTAPQTNLPICLPDIDFIRVFRSKWETYKILFAADPALVPRTMMLMEDADIEIALTTYSTPVWIRGCVGQAAETAFRASTAALGAAWLLIRDGHGTYTASEFLPGRNLAWTALYDNGDLVCSTVHERVSYFNAAAAPSGVTGVAAVSRTLHDDQVGHVGAQAIKAVSQCIGKQLSGIVTLDMKEAEDGSPKVTEINPRPTNTLHLTKAGCNFAAALVEVSQGKRPNYPQFNACRPAVYYLRDIDCPPIILDETDLM